MTAKTYDRQTAKFLAVVGENMPELSGVVMQGWIENTKALQKILEKAFSIRLLSQVAPVKVKGAKKFVARDHLESANVGFTGSNFDKLFLGKVEENVGDANLVASRLEKASLDAPILVELDKLAETSLAYLFDLLKKQNKGEDGVLLANGYVNIFYIRGNDGHLWAVSARWDSGYRYWRVGAYSVEGPAGWGAGYRVFSGDS